MIARFLGLAPLVLLLLGVALAVLSVVFGSQFEDHCPAYPTGTRCDTAGYLFVGASVLCAALAVGVVILAGVRIARPAPPRHAEDVVEPERVGRSL
jgi:hypothetical protein